MVECRFNKETRTLACLFSGRLDALRAREDGEKLARELDKLEKDGFVIFDLAGVEYVSSAFLRLCLATARRAGAGRFSVVNSRPETKKVFSVAGLDSVLQVD